MRKIEPSMFEKAVMFRNLRWSKLDMRALTANEDAVEKESLEMMADFAKEESQQAKKELIQLLRNRIYENIHSEPALMTISHDAKAAARREILDLLTSIEKETL